MKEFLTVAALLVVTVLLCRSPRPVSSADVVRVKTPGTPAPPEPRSAADNDTAPAASARSFKSADNGTTPCDRYLRAAEMEVRNPRNHKFVTSNGWTDRQRPRPEINVYSRIEELPSSPPPPPPPYPAVAAYYQQQRDNYYQQSRQQLQPNVRTSKRIIYYATLPEVVRTPVGYAPPAPNYPADPFAPGLGPYSADFRQLDSNRNSGPSPADHLQRNRVAPYENAYNNRGVTSVTSKSTAVFNSRYDEPAEFRDSFYRPNDFTSRFASWAEPFYKSWTSSPPPWDRDRDPATRFGGTGDPVTRFGSRGSSPFPWDREPLGGGGLWDNNRGASWDKELVEVPLQKPDRVRGGYGDDTENRYNPEVAVVQSGVIDVRSDRRQQSASPPPPPGRFTIIDVDPRPYQPPRPDAHEPLDYDERRNPMMTHHQQQQHASMRYDPPQKPLRYETYAPMQPPTRYEHDQPVHRYEQQYRPPAPPSSAHYGQQNQNKQPPSNGYYETVKNNNVNTHQFMTSWTEVSTQDEVSPTHTVSLDISALGNSTSVHNNTRIVPYTNNSTKAPK